MKATKDKDKDLQGEGNYDAARRYDEKTRAFVRSGRVPDAAEQAKPHSDAEAGEMERAEEKGRSHARK
jgi:hypothetical protein